MPPFKQRFTIVYDMSLAPGQPPVGFVWDDLLLVPVSEYGFEDTLVEIFGDYIKEDFRIISPQFSATQEATEYIAKNNRAGPNGETLTWDEIEKQYGATNFPRSS